MQYTRLVRNLFPLVLLLAIADASASAVIQDLRLEYVDGELQAVITVDGETRPRAFASSELSLVVVDLPDTLLQREFQLPAAPAAGIIQAIRHALGDDGRLRLVFDLQEPARFRVTSVTVDDNFEVHTIYFMPEEGAPLPGRNVRSWRATNR